MGAALLHGRLLLFAKSILPLSRKVFWEKKKGKGGGRKFPRFGILLKVKRIRHVA